MTAANLPRVAAVDGEEDERVDGDDLVERAVGVVQDARRAVREHESGRGEAVDRSGRDPNDHERQDVAHGVCLPGVAPRPRVARYDAGAP